MLEGADPSFSQTASSPQSMDSVLTSADGKNRFQPFCNTVFV